MAFWTAQSLLSKQNALFLSLCFGVGRRSHLGFSVHHDKTHHADHRPPLPPGGAPALAAKLPARETTAGAPNGPWPASHWAASSNALVFYRPMPVPPFPFQSLIRGGGVLTADRRPADDTLHIPDRLEQPPTAIPRPTHVDDCQPPILSVTGDQDEETSMSLRTAALGLARAATRRPFSTTMASPSSPSSTTPMADTIREKVTSPHLTFTFTHATTHPTHPTHPPTPLSQRNKQNKKSLNS